MSKLSSVPQGIEYTVPSLLAGRKRNDILLFIICFFTIFSLTPLLTLYSESAGVSIIAGCFAALVLTVAIVRWPSFGLFIIAGCVFVVEQEPLPTPILTDNLPIFHWPPQLEGFIERPIGLLLLFTLLIWLFHHYTQHRPLLRGGALFLPFLLYTFCAVGGIIYGLATGGDLKVIIVEIRPFWYMFLSYLLAYNFVTTKKQVRNFFWLAIIGAGIKAIQGLYIYQGVYHGNIDGLDQIMAHEESFFFAALLLLITIFLLHYRHRWQLIVALCMSPIVLITMVANHRRTDYIALLIGIVVAWVLVFQIKPKARPTLVVSMLILVVLGTGYVVAFAHGSGSIAEPARGIISVFQPDTSDTRNANSNLYRVFENNDLKFTVKQYPLGLGFGKQFMQPEPLTSIFPTIKTYDPYYNYVPHNTIYWIWVDLGPIGYFSLWLLIGSIVIYGTVLVRKLRDPYLQVATIYVVSVTMMEVLAAYADYQLFFYRNVIYIGLLCGMMAKLPTLDKQDNGHEANLSEEHQANEKSDESRLLATTAIP